MQFVTQIINSILSACHLVSRVSLLLLTGQVIILIATVLLIKYTQSSLTFLILINGGTPVLVSVCSSLWYYTHNLKEFSPSLKLVDFKYTKELINLGGLFFAIQIGALVLFQTDNIIITQLFGPADVTVFNIAYKLFSAFILGFDIIIAPLWSAFTDAYIKGDFNWIKSIMRKMRYVCLIISLGSILLFFMSPFIYKLWLHNNVIVPTTLSLAMVLYVVAYTWQTIHVYFLNGINKIRLQLYLVIISAAVNIPLSIFLGKKIGLAGITLANSILFVIMGLIFSYQVKRILSKTAKGILNA